MLTIDAMKEFGANTEEGVARCINNEGFYLKLVKKIPTDKNFDELKNAIEAQDLERAFEAAHALKGVLANLSLTPILEPVSEMTEHLRSREQMDYSSYLETIAKKKDELTALCEE